jgi:plasmid rolling circle replication initiator protein Rep
MALKLEYLKNQSLEACESLRQIHSEGMHLMRQQRCAEFLQYAIDPEDWTERLNRANFCHQKTCPVCAYIRTSKLRIRLFNGMPRLRADYPAARFLLLTLTVKNCHYQELRSHIRMMEAGFHRMHCNSAFPAIGFLKSVEVTRPRDYYYYGQYIGRLSGGTVNRWRSHLEKLPSWDYRQWRSFCTEEAHPHFHVLMMVNESYFVRDGDEYLAQKEWQQMWKRSARLDYDPVVDIRVADRLNGSILEVSKYCIKTSDMIDVIGCLAMRQLHGRRLISIGGVFSDYFSQKALDAIAQTGKLGNEHWQQGAPCHYQWVNDHYSLVRLANLEWEAG